MRARRAPVQWFAILTGSLLLAIGLLTVSLQPVNWASTHHPVEFLVWQASGWNTILWMGMGALALLSSTSGESARPYCTVAAFVFGAVALWGIVDGGASTMAIFTIGTAGNVMHATIAAAAIALRELSSDHRPRRLAQLVDLRLHLLAIRRSAGER